MRSFQIKLFVVFVALIGLSTAASAQSAAAANREYKRLNTLAAALKKIPFDRYEREPHRSFLKRNNRDIVYSEPAGEWYVRSERFWDLQKRNAKLPIADDIAWTAADNPLPGECEGYVNCYMYKIRATYGEYLNLYPAGKHAAKAMKRLVEYQEYMAEDTRQAQRNYQGPVDDADRKELRKLIAEMRGILSKTNAKGKSTAVAQLDAIEKTFAK